MSELEFLDALHIHFSRRRELAPYARRHELFQTSTVQALLGGSFDGDVSLTDILAHGDLGLGTFDGLDGELIVIDGEAWRASADCSLAPAAPSSVTPYAVVVPFSPGASIALRGPLAYSGLGLAVGRPLDTTARPAAIRIDGRFERLRVRSVPKQRRPYPQLADALAQQRSFELLEVRGTMVGFGFPSALDGVEMTGWHLHFATEDRARGGHVLGFSLLDGVARVDDATELHVELPPAVEAHPDDVLGQETLHRLESDP